MKTVISNATRELVIGDGQPTVLIGELHPGGGTEKTSEAASGGELDRLQKMAIDQVQAGADAIDVHVGTPGIDEVEFLPRAIEALMKAVDVPFCFGSSNVQALEAALKAYRGKALINSVTGEEDSLSAILPLAKRYGAAVIGRVRESRDFPDTAGERLAIARRIVERARAVGISPDNVIIDCLTFSPAVEKHAGAVTLETVRRVNTELGVNTTIGDRHLTYGLPETDFLNNTFVAVAIGAGVSCFLLDVTRVRASVLAADLMAGRDPRALRYLKAYRQMGKSK